MKAKLIIEDREIEVEISEEEYKKLQPSEEKKTGYERVPEDGAFYYATSKGYVEYGRDTYDYIDDEYYESANYYSSDVEDCYDIDDEYYASANYYSDKTVAENNARADKLMRQLRRFSVEHREREVDLNDINTKKFFVTYNYENNEIRPGYTFQLKSFGTICLDSREVTQAAINEFYDELIWYFTEYKDSL